MNEEQTVNQDGTEVAILTPPYPELNISNAWKFRLKIQENIARTNHMVINLEQVNSIDSSGLTALVAGMREAEKSKGTFRLCSLSKEARLVFEVTMMDTVFDIFESLDEALGTPRYQNFGLSSNSKDGAQDSPIAADNAIPPQPSPSSEDEGDLFD